METCGRLSKLKLQRRQDDCQEVLFRTYKKWRPSGAYDGLLVLWVTNSINFLSPNNIKSQFREKVTRIASPQVSCVFWLHQQHRIPANLFLSQTPESFVLTGISENGPATSKDFRRFSEELRTFPKMSEDVPTNFEHLRSHLKGDKVSVFWKNYDTKSTLSPFMKYFCGNCRNWISFIDHVLNSNSSGFMSQAWEIVLDAWDRCL